jgi:maltooligosyltrehalose trehalohydrolase
MAGNIPEPPDPEERSREGGTEFWRMAEAAAARLDRPQRRLPVGAEPVGGSTHFRVWAPAARELAVVVQDSGERQLEPEPDGYFSGWDEDLGAGARYGYRLDRGEVRPDPVSRFQPDGPLGLSMVVDPGRYAWRDTGWPGVPRTG